MANSAESDQLASRSQLIWIFTVCKDRVYPGSAGQGLKVAVSMIPLTFEPFQFDCISSPSLSFFVKYEAGRLGQQLKNGFVL